MTSNEKGQKGRKEMKINGKKENTKTLRGKKKNRKNKRERRK